MQDNISKDSQDCEHIVYSGSHGSIHEVDSKFWQNEAAKVNKKSNKTKNKNTMKRKYSLSSIDESTSVDSKGLEKIAYQIDGSPSIHFANFDKFNVPNLNRSRRNDIAIDKLEMKEIKQKKIKNQLKKSLQTTADILNQNKLQLSHNNQIETNEFTTNVQNTATNLVNQVLNEASQHVNMGRIADSNANTNLTFNPLLPQIPNQDSRDFCWPDMFNFRHDRIIEYTAFYIMTWKLPSIYKFCIEYLGCCTTDISIVYRVRAIFYTPTIDCPNPQVTASCYFRIEVNNIIPQNSPVRVTYQFEGFSQIYPADNRCGFQSRLIYLIIDEKLKLFRQVNL